MAEIRQKIISCSQGHYYDAQPVRQLPLLQFRQFLSHGGPLRTPGPGRQPPRWAWRGPGLPWAKTMGGSALRSRPSSQSASPALWGRPSTWTLHSRRGPLPRVVGWLVAVSGPCRGTDYRIHTGYNYIGREAGDICIRGDSTISAEKDATSPMSPRPWNFTSPTSLGKTCCW